MNSRDETLCRQLIKYYAEHGASMKEAVDAVHEAMNKVYSAEPITLQDVLTIARKFYGLQS